MPQRLFRLYQRKRIININVNVTASGLLSTAVVMLLLWPLQDHLTDWPAWGYTAFAAVADVVLDVAIFTGLHWIANHWRPLKGLSTGERRELEAAAPHPVRDAAQLQAERFVISPLYYVIAIAGMQGLQHLGLHSAWAAGIAYPAGLLVTRTVHTIWGLRSGSYHDHHVRLKRERISARQKARREREAEHANATVTRR